VTLVELSVLALLSPGDAVVKPSAACDAATWTGTCTVRVGELERTYRGQLLLRGKRLIWRANVEDVVAAIVASESEPGAPAAALEAQAIAARSFLLAGPRHKEFGFCDTTHCQHFKTATADSARAAKATAGLILIWESRPVRAVYSASCGGRTKTAKEVGWPESSEYPYFAVPCKVCQLQEPQWVRRLPASELAAIAAGNREESARLRVGRELGWDAVPSNNYSVNGGVLTGRGRGHGVGLCQRGAAGLAREGWSALRILEHYYPGTLTARIGAQNVKILSELGQVP